MSFQAISIAFFAALKVAALSEIILLGFPLLAINLQNASRKCSAVISSTTSKCTARTAMQVNRHIHTFFRFPLFLTYNGPKQSTPVLANGDDSVVLLLGQGDITLA